MQTSNRYICDVRVLSGYLHIYVLNIYIHTHIYIYIYIYICSFLIKLNYELHESCKIAYILFLKQWQVSSLVYVFRYYCVLLNFSIIKPLTSVKMLATFYLSLFKLASVKPWFDCQFSHFDMNYHWDRPPKKCNLLIVIDIIKKIQRAIKSKKCTTNKMCTTVYWDLINSNMNRDVARGMCKRAIPGMYT